MPAAKTARQRWEQRGEDGTLDGIKRSIESGAREVDKALQSVGKSKAWTEIGGFFEKFIGVILLLFANRKADVGPYIVVIRCDDHKSEEAAVAYLKKSTRRCVVKSKTAQKGSVELNMEVRLAKDNTDFINTLADMPGVQSAVLVSYNGDYMG